MSFKLICVGIRAQVYILGIGRWLVRGWINSNEGVKLKIPRVRCKQKDWEGGLKKSIFSDEHSTDQRYTLSIRAAFQEVPLIGMCITNAQEGWRLRGI